MFPSVATLADLEAGSTLGTALLALDFSALSEADLLAVARAWERQDRYVAARRNALYAALDASTGPAWEGQPVAACAEEWDGLVARARARSLAGSTGMSNTAATARIDAAVELVGRLSETGDALAAGLLPEACARLIARQLFGVDDVTAAAVQAAVLPLAPKLTYGRLDRLVRREIAQRAPDQAVADNQLARRDRHVTAPRVQYDGMASLQVHGPAEDLATLHAAVVALGDATQAAAKAAAGGSTGDSIESIHALRFDALINLACAALADDTLPRRHGRRPAIQLTVPAATLLGLSDAPGELDGYGPLDAETARAIAHDPTATWRRILTDPEGRVVDVGATTYRPPQAMKDLILTRDRTCTAPGCARPARTCQLDHTVPYPHGPTSPDNLDSKCQADHNLKTAGLFAVSRDLASGETTWIDRHGTSYVRPPETVVIDPGADERLRALFLALVKVSRPAHRADVRGSARRGARVLGSAPVPDDDPPPF